MNAVFLFEGRPSADEGSALLWDMAAVCGVQGAACGHQLLLTLPFASSSLTDVTVRGSVGQTVSWWSLVYSEQHLSVCPYPQTCI